jgi:hypothetical protein
MPFHKHLRELWVKAGYPGNMGSACVVPPPPKGIRRLYRFMTAEHAKDSILSKQLKVARFNELNDPFELLAYEATSETMPIKEFKQRLHRECGLLCFSADWTDPVLWSHYATKHRGICIGVNLKENLEKKVIYSQSRLKNLMLGNEKEIIKIDDELADVLLRTKFENWNYERESRVLISLSNAIKEGDHYFYPFNEQLEFAEVILGQQCGMQISEFKSLVASLYPNAVAIKSRLAKFGFAVVPEEKTIPALK